MRKIVLLPALLAISACGGGEEAAEPVETDASAESELPLAGEEPGFEAVAPGEYEVTTSGEEGTSLLTIHPGMTWSMVHADGEAEGGTIYMQAGETCFVTEGEDGSDCFTTGETAEDGTMTNSSSEGTEFTVRPVGSSEAAAANTEI